MKTIIKYKIFKSSEDFELWQQSYDNINIHTITPCPVEITNTYSSTILSEGIPEWSKGYWDTGILVIYTEVKNTDEIPS